MSFIRKKKNRGQIYYAEVENRKVNGNVVQRYIRYIGKNPDVSRSIMLEPVHFSYITTRLMQGDLTSDELLDMLEAVGIRYSFKKTVLRSPSTTPGSQEGREM